MIILRITIQKKSSESFSLWHGETIEHCFGKSAAPFFLFFCTGRRHHPWQPLQINQSINQLKKIKQTINQSITSLLDFWVQKSTPRLALIDCHLHWCS